MSEIVKNCPCFNNERFIENYLEDGDNYCPYKETKCENITDCVMKRIVEKCKGVQEKFYDAVHSRYLSPSKAKFAREIIDLLQIQEVE